MWSDATGLQECTKASTKPPSLQWTWVSSRLWVGQGLNWGSAQLTHPSRRFPTGPWTSAFLGALTRRGGSTPVTSLRKHLSLCQGQDRVCGPARPSPQQWPHHSARQSPCPLPPALGSSCPLQLLGIAEEQILYTCLSCQQGLEPAGEVWRRPGELGPVHLTSVDRLREDAMAPPHLVVSLLCWAQVVGGPAGDLVLWAEGPLGEIWARP